MPPNMALIEQLMKTASRRELQERPDNWSANLILPQAQKLTRYLNELEAVGETFRLGIVHTYTSDLLDPWLNFHAAAQGLALSTYHAPYGMNLMEAQAGSGLDKHQPDLTLFMLQREDLHPDLALPIASYGSEQQTSLRQQAEQRLLGILAQFRQHVSGRFVVTILPSHFSPGLGMYDSHSGQSENSWWAQLKQSLCQHMAKQIESTLLMDMDDLLAEIGRPEFFDLRFWYASRFPFKPKAANLFARKLLDIGMVQTTPKAKVIVLDADNTLWGGVIGEEGIQGIGLGPDYPGNVYVDFQRRILDFKERGFILALCSKNNEQDVLEVFQQHPHQLLKQEHFAAMRINWLPKHDNIKSLAKELNLGLDSFVFVDDSDYECGMVRRELPMVQVVQVPSKVVNIPSCLEQLTRLEVVSLTQEDKDKTRMYAQQRQRQQLQQEMNVSGSGIDDYLRSLEMKMEIQLNPSDRVARLAQLTQKTNQFNLTTQRYSEQEIQQLIDSDGWLVASFSLGDSFGDSGTVGLALIQYQTNHQAKIDTFLMSCRVIGRKAESAFLEALLNQLAQTGVTSVVAEFIPSLKNALVSDFYPQHDFVPDGDAGLVRHFDQHPAGALDEFPMQVCVRE